MEEACVYIIQYKCFITCVTGKNGVITEAKLRHMLETTLVV